MAKWSRLSWLPRAIRTNDSKALGKLAPANEHIEAVESRVRRKSSWIFRELDRVECGGLLTPPRYFLSGETHLLLGKPYRLQRTFQRLPDCARTSLGNNQIFSLIQAGA